MEYNNLTAYGNRLRPLLSETECRGFAISETLFLTLVLTTCLPSAYWSCSNCNFAEKPVDLAEK